MKEKTKNRLVKISKFMYDCVRFVFGLTGGLLGFFVVMTSLAFWFDLSNRTQDIVLKESIILITNFITSLLNVFAFCLMIIYFVWLGKWMLKNRKNDKIKNSK